MARSLSSIVPMDDLLAEELERRDRKIVDLQAKLTTQANKHHRELELLQDSHRQEKDWMMRYMSDAMKHVKPGTYGRPG